ncbi:MAG TPA: DUF2905 domain-containing protein [Gemmataceae bacterium]|jgi:hypothetical protein
MNGQASFGWMLLVIGLVVAGIGVRWIGRPSLPLLGRLPGDIRVEGEHVRFTSPR